MFLKKKKFLMKIKNNFTKYAECIFPYKLNMTLLFKEDNTFFNSAVHRKAYRHLLPFYSLLVLFMLMTYPHTAIIACNEAICPAAIAHEFSVAFRT